MAVKNRQQLHETLLNSYSQYYDLYPAQEDTGLPMFARAEYHSFSERYVLTKEAKLYGMENHEYAYFFSTPELDRETAEKCIDHALADGLPRVKPHPEHMNSDIGVVFLADSITPDAAAYLKRRRYYKSYRFTLQGWSRLKILAADLGKESVLSNGDAKKEKKSLKKIIYKE